MRLPIVEIEDAAKTGFRAVCVSHGNSVCRFGVTVHLIKAGQPLRVNERATHKPQVDPCLVPPSLASASNVARNFGFGVSGLWWRQESSSQQMERTCTDQPTRTHAQERAGLPYMHLYPIDPCRPSCIVPFATTRPSTLQKQHPPLITEDKCTDQSAMWNQCSSNVQLQDCNDWRSAMVVGMAMPPIG